jgi:DNA polymerase-3 subunit gamma/tau
LPDQISAHLEKILQAESIEAEPSAIMRIARAADGSMRDGLSLLDQAIAFGGGSLKDVDVATMLGSIDHVHIAAIIDALCEANANALLEIVDELSLQSRNFETVLDELAEAMHRIAMIQAAPDFRDPERSDWDSLVERADRISAEDAQLYYQIAITGRRDLGISPDPRTGLEMTLLRMLAFRPANSQAGSEPGVAPARETVVPTPAKAAKPARAAKSEAGTSNGDAAKEARAAFDALAEDPQKSVDETTESGVPGSDTDWSNLQSRLKLSGAARELARNLQLESADKDRWSFLVPDTLQHLGSKSVVQNLQSALSDCLGHRVMLDLHTAGEPLQSVAAAAEAAESSLMSEAERAIDEDQTVQQMRDKFGAKIVPDSIQPLQ